MKKIWMVILFVYFSSFGVDAIGVSPGKILIYFEPGLKSSEDFSAVNSLDRETNLKFNVFGSLEEYVFIEVDEDVIAPRGVNNYKFDYSLPQTLNPGDHRTDISIAEVNSNEEGGSIAANAAVGLVFIVRVPFEGQHLSAKLSASDATAGDNVTFEVYLESLGKENIPSIQGELKIYDEEGNFIDEVLFPEQSLGNREVRDIQVVWDSNDKSVGKYSADLLLRYSDKEVQDSTEFKLGVLNVEILELLNSNLVKGKINKIEVLTKNSWNGKIENAYTEVIFDGRKVRTDDINYEPWEEKIITSFADATQIEDGSYKLIFSLYFDDESVSKTFNVSVSSFNYSLLSSISGIMAIVIVIIILILFKRRRINKKKLK